LGGLGALMFASRMGNTDAESARIIHQALDAGIDLLDTQQYGMGVSRGARSGRACSPAGSGAGRRAT
jgi:aryl-alcohol dehydrogenase-like predicted oxidoreductase